MPERWADNQATEKLREIPEKWPPYRKANSCRNFNFGVAALAYFRRVVENQMNNILDLLSEAAREADFGKETLEKIEEVKRNSVFDEKLTCGSKISQPYWKPVRSNPMDVLHEITNRGYRRSEVESIEIFDRCKLLFEYVFRELQSHREDEKAYVEALHTLSSVKSKAG